MTVDDQRLLRVALLGFTPGPAPVTQSCSKGRPTHAYYQLGYCAYWRACGRLAFVAASQPAEAGRACNELGLSSPCIRSNGLKARINLDEDGVDGRLRVRDAAGENGVELSATSGNVTNLFSNDQNESNGLVKAWAQINSDGTIAACWRCNIDPLETGRIGAGQYEVDFTLLATDITGRPRLANIDEAIDGEIALLDRSGDASSVFVLTSGSDGLFTDRSFVLIIFWIVPAPRWPTSPQMPARCWSRSRTPMASTPPAARSSWSSIDLTIGVGCEGAQLARPGA